MPPKISVEEMELIMEVFHYFESESKRGTPFYTSNNISKRTIHCLKISESLLKKLLRENSNDEEKERFKERRIKFWIVLIKT